MTTAARDGGAKRPPVPPLNGTFLSYDPTRGVGSFAESDAVGTGTLRCVLQRAEPEGAVPELILGESNLLPFHFLRTGDRIGRTVVKIERGDGAAGTGFLVSPGILLTNHHVLPDTRTAASARAHANYEYEPPAGLAGKAASVPLRPESLFVTCAELDFSFCGVAGLDYLGCVPLRRDSLSILPAEYVSIIQHPRGGPKQVALQDSRVVRLDSVVVHYCCDTEPGSSGSPVFNNLWRLVALHHASVESKAPGARRAAGMPGTVQYLNEGIRISAIALWLESVEANTPELRGQTARIRAAFADLDGQAGYFGALGRRAGDRSVAELVIDAYGPQGDTLDVAYWNLERVAGAAAERMSELGRVVAEMGADVWCLAGLGKDALRLLAEHLDAHFRLDYHPDDGREGVGLLWRRRSGRSVAWLPRRAGMPRRAVVGEPGGLTSLEPVPRGREAAPGLLAVAGEPDERLLIGDGLGPDDAPRLGAGALAAFGAGGGVVFVPDPTARRDAVFVSPNLDRLAGPPAAVVVGQDRRWPRALDELSVPLPMAVRLVRNRRTSGRAPAVRPAG